MSELRILSYLPNPRVWKATIAARLCGIDVEVRGALPQELTSWLWGMGCPRRRQSCRRGGAAPL
jgi:hypothetical protein